jgi:hypothetical protein
MSSNRPPDSSRRAPLASALKIDSRALVVLALTLFFASLFATLVLLRPEASDPTEPLPADLRSAQSVPRVNPPSVKAPPVSTPPVNAPPLSAPPPAPIASAEPKPEPKPDPTLQTRLEQLGIKCAKGANCYPD